VSLTSIPCKLLEAVVKDKMMDQLVTNNLIKSTQHGFMPGRSYATNLTSFLDNVVEARDNGKSINVNYLDFSRAFDKVQHYYYLPDSEERESVRRLWMDISLARADDTDSESRRRDVRWRGWIRRVPRHVT
jgi:hypothetical protein